MDALTRLPARLHARLLAAPRGQAGASSVEYALLVTLIAVVIIAAVTVFGQNVAGLFAKSATSVSR